MAAIASWMRSNKLQLNADKTEVLWYTIGRRQHQPQRHTDDRRYSCFCIVIRPRPRVHIDGDLVMLKHVQKTVLRCFAVLRQLRQIRRSVPQPTFQSLVVTGKLTTTLWQRRPILCVVCSQSSTQPRDSRRYCSLSHILTFG